MDLNVPEPASIGVVQLIKICREEIRESAVEQSTGREPSKSVVSEGHSRCKQHVSSALIEVVALHCGASLWSSQKEFFILSTAATFD